MEPVPPSRPPGSDSPRGASPGGAARPSRGRLVLLLALLLGGLALGLALPRNPSPAPGPCPSDRLLDRVEEALIAAPGENCGSRAVYEDLLASLRAHEATRCPNLWHSPIVHRLHALWLTDGLRTAFLDQLPGELRSDERDRLLHRYFRALGRRWVLEVCGSFRRGEDARRAVLCGPGRAPGRLARYRAHEAGCRKDHGGAIGPASPVYFLYQGFFDERRARNMARLPLGAWRALGHSWPGLRVCDVGTAVGAPLADYEEAVGPGGHVVAQDLNPYSLDFVRFQIEERLLTRTTVVVGEEDDGLLPPGSQDVITMAGVHMGKGLGESYEASTRPWLASLGRALRPGGFLLMDEGNEFTRGEIVGAFRPAGLDLVEWLAGPAELGYAWLGERQFLAVLRKR